MGIRLNRLGEAVQTNTHNLCFEQKCEKISDFFFICKFHFLVAKFSIYLNRHVFVMNEFSLPLLLRLPVRCKFLHFMKWLTLFSCKTVKSVVLLYRRLIF